MTPTEYRIQNVNGIDDLQIRIDGPGVYVARGPNGAGKSSAIEALKAASGDPDAKAEPTDGIDKGKIESTGGVLLSVGSRRRMNGLPTVRLVSTGAIGGLIDPGIKDSKLAARARLRALVRLMPLPADEPARLELTGNDEELQLWIKSDPSTDAIDLAEAVRMRANELACDLEKRAAACEGEEASLNGLIQELGELDFAAGDLNEAIATATNLERQAAIATQTAKARQNLERQKEEIRANMGEPPNVSAAQEAVLQAQKELVEARSRYNAAEKAYHDADRQLNEAKAANEKQRQSRYILDRPVEGPTLEEAAAVEAQAEAAKARVERARKIANAKTLVEKATGAHEAGIKAAERAKVLRTIAQGTAEAIGRLLERRGLPGMKIVDGRLCVQDGEKLKDFDERLSFGQRVRVALGAALAGLQQPANETRLPLIPLEPTFWLALDEEKKAEVCAIAKERGICLVTEEPDRGPLRIEPMN